MNAAIRRSRQLADAGDPGSSPRCPRRGAPGPVRNRCRPDGSAGSWRPWRPTWRRPSRRRPPWRRGRRTSRPARAAATLPAWLNASLRPIRRGSRPWPTSPRLIAETAGAKIADDAPMTACAAMITGSVGHHAIATHPQRDRQRGQRDGRAARRGSGRSAPPPASARRRWRTPGPTSRSRSGPRPSARGRQEDGQERAQAVADVGHEDVQGVERDQAPALGIMLGVA